MIKSNFLFAYVYNHKPQILNLNPLNLISSHIHIHPKINPQSPQISHQLQFISLASYGSLSLRNIIVQTLCWLVAFSLRFGRLVCGHIDRYRQPSINVVCSLLRGRTCSLTRFCFWWGVLMGSWSLPSQVICWMVWCLAYYIIRYIWKWGIIPISHHQPSFIICTNCSKKTFPFSLFLLGPGSAYDPFSIIFSIYSEEKSIFSWLQILSSSSHVI